MSFKIQSKGNVIKIVGFVKLFCGHYFYQVSDLYKKNAKRLN